MSFVVEAGLNGCNFIGDSCKELYAASYDAFTHCTKSVKKIFKDSIKSPIVKNLPVTLSNLAITEENDRNCDLITDPFSTFAYNLICITASTLVIASFKIVGLNQEPTKLTLVERLNAKASLILFGVSSWVFLT